MHAHARAPHTCTRAHTHTQGGKLTCMDVLRTREFVLIILIRGVAGFVTFAGLDLAPLWAATSQDYGGLSLNRNQIGLLLSGLKANLKLIPHLLLLLLLLLLLHSHHNS